MSATVALVTDFGTADSYVAELELAITRCVPSVHVVGVTHDIPAFDRVAAALVIERLLAQMISGAIVAVVDPGVGTARGRIFARRRGVWLVGPDNGVLPIGASRDGLWSIREAAVPRAMRGTTFDGREIFGPIAAYLAGGMDPDLAGHRVREVVAPVLPVDAEFQTKPDARYAHGVVIALDRYGNAVTNIRPDVGAERLSVVEPSRFAGPLHRAYGEVARGEPVVLLGSSGRVGLAVREGRSGVAVGQTVAVRCAS